MAGTDQQSFLDAPNGKQSVGIIKNPYLKVNTTRRKILYGCLVLALLALSLFLLAGILGSILAVL